MRLCLYQPDIPQNAGAMIRLGAALGVGLDIVEPCGFLLTDRGLARAAMDYRKSADIRRHESWDRFRAGFSGRLVLLTTRGDRAYTDFAFAADDTLMVGRESAGVPQAVHDTVQARLVIPLKAGMRSLNVAQAAAMVLGEALRQTHLFRRPMGDLMHLTLLEPGGLVALAQVLMIDIVLAGDNAVVIGLAAARVPLELRNKVILWGLVAAVVLRVGLAAIAVKLLGIIGLTLAGGILLLWVCWRFWRDIRGGAHHDAPRVDAHTSLRQAVLQIVLADVSMSLDNVLAVAGAARDHLDVLVIGLLLSVGLMGAAANVIARLLERYRWISYIGLAIVLYVAATMIWHGGHQVLGALGAS